MYAIAEIQGKQYKIDQGLRLKVEKIKEEDGTKITLDKVLLFSDGKRINIGQPYLQGVSVDCEIMAQVKDKKKIVFKYRRRKSSQTKRGHRQKLTEIEIKEIKHK